MVADFVHDLGSCYLHTDVTEFWWYILNLQLGVGCGHACLVLPCIGSFGTVKEHLQCSHSYCVYIHIYNTRIRKVLWPLL